MNGLTFNSHLYNTRIFNSGIVADFSNPMPLSFSAPFGQHNGPNGDVAIYEDKLYYAGSKIDIYDISDPSTPNFLGFAEMSAVQGARSKWSKLYMYTVSDI